METSVITALAGIFGSLTGGAASVATAWVAQRARNKRELLRSERSKREALYGEFINECSSRIMDSLERSLDKPDTLLTLYAILNRIRLRASAPVLAQATELVKLIIDQYYAPSITVEEFHERVSKDGTDPLRAFSEACRKELRSLHAPL